MHVMQEKNDASHELMHIMQEQIDACDARMIFFFFFFFLCTWMVTLVIFLD